MVHFKPCSGRKPVSMCGWQEWGENYGLRLQEMVVYVAPLALRELQHAALNSNVLTHYSLERRTWENTGVQSTELVVSFTIYFCRNKLWHSTLEITKFYLPKRPLSGECMLEASDMSLCLGGVHLWWHHPLLAFHLSHWTVHPGLLLCLLLFFSLLHAHCSWISLGPPSLNYKLGPMTVSIIWIPATSKFPPVLMLESQVYTFQVLTRQCACLMGI